MADKKATEEELSELHKEFAGYLKTFLRRSKRIMDAAEDDDQVEPNGSILNVVKGFLKDNHIEVDPVGGNGRKGDFDALTQGLDKLPFDDSSMTTGSEPH